MTYPRPLRHLIQGLNQAHARIILFYVSLSPVFLAPILFVYLERELGLEIKTVLGISALYAIAMLALDIPLGIIADRYGAKTTLFGGLLCYIGGISALLAFSGPKAYHLYFLLTTIGYPCTSGADISLVRQQINEADPGALKKYIYYLQRWSYVIYALIHLIAPVLYTWDKRLPFLMQIALLSLSLVNLAFLKESRGKLRPKRRRVFGDFALCLRLCLLNRKFLTLVVCSSVFNLGISINHKVIQHQLMDYMPSKEVTALGVIYALASLSSAVGTSSLANRLKGLALNRQILCLLCMLILSFLAMGVHAQAFIIAGFLLVNLFKGGYRPLLNAELTQNIPVQRLTAQALSIATSAASLLAGGMQWALSSRYVDPARGNVLFAFLAAGLVLSALVYSNLCYTWTIFEKRSRSTGKKSALICTNGRFRFLQYYPLNAKLEHFRDIKWINAMVIYPTPSITWHFNTREICVEMPYLGDVKLSDLKDSARQFACCRSLLEAFCFRQGPDRPALVPKPEDVFLPPALDLLKKLPKMCRECIIHGALEPRHVMVLHSQCQVIDWNCSGRGPWWWDVLMLLSHPHLHFVWNERIDLLRRISHAPHEVHLGDLLAQFCSFRAQQLTRDESSGARQLDLSRRYIRLSEAPLAV